MNLSNSQISVLGSVKTRAALIYLAVILLGGCATASDSIREVDGRLQVKWREEVQLSDGRVIVAERSDEYIRVSDPGSGWGRGGWLHQRGSVRATLPAPISQTVSWAGTLKPLVLDIFPGDSVFLVTAVTARVGRDEWRVPDNEKYVVFHLSRDGWQRVPLSKLPDSAKPNLLARSSQVFENKDLKSGSMIDLKRKQEIDSDPLLIQEYRMIVRPRNEPLK